MKRKVLTNNEFLNRLDGILPENDRSKLIKCYPEEEQAKIIAQSDSNKLNYEELQAQDGLWVDDIYEEEDEAA